MLDSGLGRVPREQEMLKGHLPRVIYHHVYLYTKIMLKRVLRSAQSLLDHSSAGSRVIKKKKKKPLSSQFCTNETAKARFWPWLGPFSGKSLPNLSRWCLLARQLQGGIQAVFNYGRMKTPCLLWSKLPLD